MFQLPKTYCSTEKIPQTTNKQQKKSKQVNIPQNFYENKIAKNYIIYGIRNFLF